MLLYREFEDNDVARIMKSVANGEAISKQEEQKCIGHIVTVAERMGFNGNLWQMYISYLLADNENAFSKSCERKGYTEGSINKAALCDFEEIRAVFNTGLSEYDAKNSSYFSILEEFENNNEDEKYFNKRIRSEIKELCTALGTAKDGGDFLQIVCDFYKKNGVGKFGMFKAFRIFHEEGKAASLVPVISTEHIRLDDLVGYEIQKKKLVDNTEAFLLGKKANNCLLFGDSGTGKSSSIKALLNEYYDKGLRMIEVYKHQFTDLSFVINAIKDRNYKFIIYMDDLSFEEFEIEYKFLKAVIEGGLEKKPNNVLIYATSNRRHLVREKYSDKEERDDDLHSRDTVQEKLSLAARFGVSIYYGSPDKMQFNNIIKALAKRNNINLPEDELYLEANKWELSHGGLSGRSAEQFINYLSAHLQKKETSQ